MQILSLHLWKRTNCFLHLDVFFFSLRLFVSSSKKDKLLLAFRCAFLSLRYFVISSKKDKYLLAFSCSFLSQIFRPIFTRTQNASCIYLLFVRFLFPLKMFHAFQGHRHNIWNIEGCVGRRHEKGVEQPFHKEFGVSPEKIWKVWRDLVASSSLYCFDFFCIVLLFRKPGQKEKTVCWSRGFQCWTLTGSTGFFTGASLGKTPHFTASA